MERKTVQIDPVLTGIDPETYQELYEIARRQNKGVNEVMSDALRKHIESNKELKENKSERKLLCEG